jgi:hypothetical protein
MGDRNYAGEFTPDWRTERARAQRAEDRVRDLMDALVSEQNANKIDRDQIASQVKGLVSYAIALAKEGERSIDDISHEVASRVYALLPDHGEAR